MTIDSRSVQQLRERNLVALPAARLGEIPDPELLRTARRLGDPVAIAECELCIATALAGKGEATKARRYLTRVHQAVQGGTQLPHLWAWRLQTQLGLAATDHGDSATAWRHHHAALGMTSEQDFDDAAIVSNLNLAFVEASIELFPQALTRLIVVLADPNRVPEHEIAARVLLAELFSRRGSTESSQEHRTRAIELAQRIATRRVARTINSMALMCQDLDNALEYVQAAQSLPSFGASELVTIEHTVLQARLSHRQDDTETAVSLLFEVVDTCEHGLAARTTALVLLAQYLSHQGHHSDALAVLSDEDLARLPPTHEVQILELRRDALRRLGRWQEAAECFETLRATQKARQLDVLTVYKLQQVANETDLVSIQNQALLENRAELETVSRDQDRILDLVATELQSPLNELRLSMSQLRQDLSAEERAHWSQTSRATVSELEGVAQDLALVGQLRAGELHVVRSDVPLSFVLDQAMATMADTMHSHGVSAAWPTDIDHVAVSSDPERLRQTLIAVLRGIAEFSTRPASIQIRVKNQPSGQVSLEVAAPQLTLTPGSIERLRQSDRLVAARGSDNPAASRSFVVAEGLTKALGITMDVHALSPCGIVFDLQLPPATAVDNFHTSTGLNALDVTTP